ncbi:3-demethylubiquinone-9 3-methyltransferase [Yersinia mollaretii]|uniref:class I SAM-dependent methyltransferase n=1 Tax=Yersinia mollaretii TaxID=33060 RepID=UPI0005DE745B|nr:class I SAM-dependent methyltransferase [Yersinia mollaretii]CNK28025.1 3-demethylubiquinone-9 3-methyltransferase [Yersinia mollaretii]
MIKKHTCKICGSIVQPIGSRNGKLDGRTYEFVQCNNCHFSFVANFREDYTEIYNENYYAGCGADPMVDYINEYKNSLITIRNYEWQGGVKIYQELCPENGKWLDFGCGSGGLVRYAKNRGIDIVGFDEGWAASLGREDGTQILTASELSETEGMFDFCSAIEVFEHIADPLAAFRQIRRVLKPGGILFLTTGNAKPWRSNLLNWGYTSCPDVHISFYEPETLELCMRESGFLPKRIDNFDLYSDIIKFKILKNIGLKNKKLLIDALPWRIISKMVDLRYQVSAQPYGVAI